jgi:hypothetical protein
MSQATPRQQAQSRQFNIGDGILVETGETLFVLSLEGTFGGDFDRFAVVSVVPVFELADNPGRFHAQKEPEPNQFVTLPLAAVPDLFSDSTGIQTVNPIFDVQRVSDTGNYPRFEITR